MADPAQSRLKVVVTLDVMMARRKMKGKDLAEQVGITEANLSLLKQGRVKGVRFETLAAICACLDCAPGDILAVEPDDERTSQGAGGYQ